MINKRSQNQQDVKKELINTCKPEFPFSFGYIFLLLYRISVNY